MGKTTPLTDTQIKQPKLAEKVITLSDGGGLQLRIKPNGSKLCIDKKPALMGLGAYPSIKLAQACKLRESVKELLAQGINPKLHRDEQEQKKQAIINNTLSSVVGNWLKLKEFEVQASTLKTINTTLTNHVLPHLGKLPIIDITAPIAIKVLRLIEAKGNLEIL